MTEDRFFELELLMPDIDITTLDRLDLSIPDFVAPDWLNELDLSIPDIDIADLVAMLDRVCVF